MFLAFWTFWFCFVSIHNKANVLPSCQVLNITNTIMADAMLEAYEPGGKYGKAYQRACAKASEALFKLDVLDFQDFFESFRDVPVSRLTIECYKVLIAVRGEIGEFKFAWNNHRVYDTGISFSYDKDFTLNDCFDFEVEDGKVWRIGSKDPEL